MSRPCGEAGIEAVAEPRVPQAVLLAVPRDVGELPGFAEGLVSVQDLGAQCVAFPLGLEPGQRVLDACAAPGGKTALMAEREPRLARLIAVDVDRKRLGRVRENLERGAARGRGRARRCGCSGRLVGRRAVRPHSARCTLLGARGHPPASRHPPAPLPAGARQDASGADAPAHGRLRHARARRPPGVCDLHAYPTRERGADPCFSRAHGRCRRRSGEDGRDGRVSARPTAAAWQILPGEAGADGFYYAALTKR